MSTVLITGANRGIGLGLAQQLQQRGDTVIAVCRKSNAELEATGARIIAGIDVTSAASLDGLLSELDGVQLDWLVNNAGILVSDSLERLDYAAMENQFRVNSMGPLRVTSALRPLLGHGSKVFIVSSRVGSIEDNSSGGNYGYRMSKVAANMLVKSLSIDLKDSGISVFALHPGYVATDMTGNQGLTGVPQSASGLIERMDELGADQTGTFWHAEGYALPW